MGQTTEMITQDTDFFFKVSKGIQQQCFILLKMLIIHDVTLTLVIFSKTSSFYELELTQLYCKDDRDTSLSSSYVNMIGPLAKSCHSFKFVQNRSKIFW